MKSNQFLKKKINAEIMKDYSLHDLKKSGTVKLLLGDIVSLKGIAIRKGFDELAEKLRQAEKKILSKK